MEAKHYKIKVDQDILDKAVREHSGKCMVADAIRNQIPGAYGIDVTADSIKFNLDNGDENATKFVYQTPGKAGKEIARFDTDGPEVIEPFEFKLDARQCSTANVKKTGTRTKPIVKKKITGQKTHPCRRSVVRRRHGLKTISDN